MASKKSVIDKEYIYISDDLNEYTSDEYADDGISAHNKSYLRTHLKLLRLAKYAKDKYVRDFAIQTIAKSQLNDYESREIAQGSDFETSVTLARIANINQKLFLPPMKTNLINLTLNTRSHLSMPSMPHFDYDEVLLHILREAYISRDNCPECTKYFTQLAISILETKRHSKEMHHMLDYNDIHAHKLKDKPKINWICLQAITENVLCDKNQCLKLVDNGLFLVLHYLREKFSDLKVKIWIAQTLANLSIYKETHLHFWHTRWLGVLAQWLQSNQLELSLPAAKILYNLNQKRETNLLPKSLYLMHPIYLDSQNKHFDLIFVHGLLGGAFKTWRQCDSEQKLETYTRCWPQKWLANDINNIRILAVNYQTFLSNWNIECPETIFSLQQRSSQLLNDLIRCKIGEKPIIWVTHSMGGLLVKQMLTDISQSNDSKVKNILEQTKGIIFYSVPHRGTEVAVWSPGIQRIISPSSQVLELRKDSQLLLSLHNQFVKIVESKQIKCLSFGETLKSTIVKKPFKLKYLLVPEESSNPGIGAFHLLPVDHFNTCKPKSKTSEAYYMASDFIKDIIDSNCDKDKTEMDNMYIYYLQYFLDIY